MIIGTYFIGDYFINGHYKIFYCWLSVVILLMVMGLLMDFLAIILMGIGGYSNNGYWSINGFVGYSIYGYWWLF